MPRQPMLVGRPVLIVVDIQGGFIPGQSTGIPHMADHALRMRRARPVIDAARAGDVPVVFFHEAHRPDMIDFGRELDGTEGVHCVEGTGASDIAADLVGLRPGDYTIHKRRYSCFFGTELLILLRGLRAETLVLVGGLTDVCVHYTFVDAHQNDYYCRVVEDCVAGSSEPAHAASLNAMEYLQTGARCSSAEIIDGFAARVPARVVQHA